MFFLISGLKDLADFLPASLATIISYFSAEVTRGVWKPVYMNGTDWPSPAANLLNVEGQIRKILAATGVDVPSLASGFLIVMILNCINFFKNPTSNAFSAEKICIFNLYFITNISIKFVFYTV